MAAHKSTATAATTDEFRRSPVENGRDNPKGRTTTRRRSLITSSPRESTSEQEEVGFVGEKALRLV
jgi:hypothetical protein